MKLVALPILFVLFCMGCSSTGKVTSEQLKYTQWQLSKVNGLAISVSQKASMRFIEAMQVNGFAGCNKFFGEGQLVEDTLTVKKLGMTRKSCGDQLDELENKLLSTLKQGAVISLNGEQLTLQGAHHFTFINTAP
ncbi:META domain-containing protein [Pseudoalteromonas lipolytica]|uniref:META domain-containing protein n=1 Tax=Pseudoalteromonas lipolytica TaxID=570156 RepID=UPI002354A074|nr:META domain-containing protein [Pseudoalteromonas lipolytica]|tara:strand:- start:157 stop:561 length:405 start_codon:yes stop_codon:yes gene_type:complete